MSFPAWEKEEEKGFCLKAGLRRFFSGLSDKITSAYLACRYFFPLQGEEQVVGREKD